MQPSPAAERVIHVPGTLNKARLLSKLLSTSRRLRYFFLFKSGFFQGSACLQEEAGCKILQSDAEGDDPALLLAVNKERKEPGRHCCRVQRNLKECMRAECEVEEAFVDDVLAPGNTWEGGGGGGGACM